jgi:hypothetical protein
LSIIKRTPRSGVRLMMDQDKGLELFKALKGVALKCVLPYYMQLGGGGNDDAVLFNRVDDKYSTRRWMLLNRLANGQAVEDADFDSVLPWDKPVRGNWKCSPKQQAFFQESVVPSFRELKRYVEETKPEHFDVIVVLQSPIDATHRETLIYGDSAANTRVKQVCDARDGDHLKVAYNTERGGHGVYVSTKSSVIRQCLMEQFGCDEDLFVEGFSQEDVDKQISLWTRAISQGKPPVVMRAPGEFVSSKKAREEY